MTAERRQTVARLTLTACFHLIGVQDTPIDDRISSIRFVHIALRFSNCGLSDSPRFMHIRNKTEESSNHSVQPKIPMKPELWRLRMDHPADSHVATSFGQRLQVFEIRCAILSLLLSCCRSDPAPVTQQDLIEVLVQNLASRGNFALYPIGCHHSSYSTTSASVIGWEALVCGRHPRRVITVICDDEEWSSDPLFSRGAIIEDLGTKYFTIIHLTELNVPDADKRRFFSFVQYEPHGDYFEILVNSDFEGEREAWRPICISRQAVAGGKVDLSRLLIFDEFLHDSPMKVYLHEDYVVEIYPKSVSNSSKPHDAAHRRHGLAMNIHLSHSLEVVPMSIDQHVAIFSNPRILANDFILFLPLRPEIWYCMGVFSAVIASIMAVTLRYPRKRNKLLISAESLIHAFCHNFTTLRIPRPSVFGSSTAAAAVLLWTVLCIIPQTGYRSSLVAWHQNPPREARFQSASFDAWIYLQSVQHIGPDFAAFVDKLQSGGAWYGSATAVNFLQSVWGLTRATYIVDEKSHGLEIMYPECEESGGIDYTCRSARQEMRWLLEMDVFHRIKCEISWDDAEIRR